jgi:hypothetical protein
MNDEIKLNGARTSVPDSPGVNASFRALARKSLHLG